VLRVIEELNHVTVAVRRFNQVCLRPAAHLADEAARINRHSRGSNAVP